MTHRCPVNGCTIDVARGVYMCARHWRMVPKPLRDAVYASFRAQPGISENHREALRVVNDSESGRAAIALPAGTKALTIWQPWASLVIMGAKPHEFRKWKFTDKPNLARLVGQRIVIHAGVRPPRLAEIDDILDRIEACESDLIAAGPFLRKLRDAVKSKDREAIVALTPLGAALGTVTLGEPKSVTELFADADSDRLVHHLYGWPMIEPKPFAAPIASMGAQGFWNWS